MTNPISEFISCWRFLRKTYSSTEILNVIASMYYEPVRLDLITFLYAAFFVVLIWSYGGTIQHPFIIASACILIGVINVMLFEIPIVGAITLILLSAVTFVVVSILIIINLAVSALPPGGFY